MLAGYLRISYAASYGQVEIQDFSSRQAAALEAIPSAQHFRGDSKIFGDRLDRISSTHFVPRRGMCVGAGVALLACGDWDDQAAFGLQRIVSQVVGFGDGFRSRVISARDRGQRFSLCTL